MTRMQAVSSTLPIVPYGCKRTKKAYLCDLVLVTAQAGLALFKCGSSME